MAHCFASSQVATGNPLAITKILWIQCSPVSTAMFLIQVEHLWYFNVVHPCFFCHLQGLTFQQMARVTECGAYHFRMKGCIDVSYYWPSLGMEKGDVNTRGNNMTDLVSFVLLSLIVLMVPSEKERLSPVTARVSTWARLPDRHVSYSPQTHLSDDTITMILYC